MLNPGTKVRWWLLWAAIPYGVVARLRALLYDWGWFDQRKLPVPVLSVGNLTLGGTGKTPVVIMLTDWLLAQGKRVAILSRGYRRTSMVQYLLVSNGERLLVGPNEAGDEPFLMAQRCPKAIVAVGADRYELGDWVLERFPIDCLVLDDGFQHQGLYRDVNLLLVDATDAEGTRSPGAGRSASGTAAGGGACDRDCRYESGRAGSGDRGLSQAEDQRLVLYRIQSRWSFVRRVSCRW